MKDTIPKDLLDMARGLMELYDLSYKSVKPKVDYIIKNKIRNIDYIDHTFDEVLNIPTQKGYELFMTLCNYVSLFNKDIVSEYLEIYQDLYGEDEIENSHTL